MSLGNKKEEKITGVIVMYDTGGGVFMTGCGSKADENGSAQVSAEEKNVTETQEQTEAESEQIMTEATETAQTKHRKQSRRKKQSRQNWHQRRPGKQKKSLQQR